MPTASTPIGPFYHETDRNNLESIRERGLVPSRTVEGSYLSLSPGEAVGGAYGDLELEIWLSVKQFKSGIKTTLGWIKSKLEREDLLQIQDLIETTSYDEFIKKANSLVKNPVFLLGELICEFPISNTQIKFPKQEQLKEQVVNIDYYKKCVQGNQQISPQTKKVCYLILDTIKNQEREISPRQKDMLDTMKKGGKFKFHTKN